MALKKVYFGSLGPFVYDDTVLVNDPDGDFAGEDHQSITTDGQMFIESTPVTDKEVLRLVDVGALAGNVIGPATSVDNAIARFDGITGKLLDDSNVLIDDAGNIIVSDDAWIGIAAAAERIIFDAIGDISFMGCSVGIETMSPEEKLHVYSSADTIVKLETGGTSNGVAFYLKGPDYGWQMWMDDDDGILRFYSTGDKVVIQQNGIVGIGTINPVISDGVGLHLDGKIIRIEDPKTPATAGSAGNVGEFCWDASYFYICVGVNSWHRVTHAAW